MSRLPALLVSLSAVFMFSVASVNAAAFEAEFEIVKATGDCSLKAPGAADFTKAAEGKKYAYGTAIKTGRSSSLVVRFSDKNGCRIPAKTTITITEDAKEKKLKILKLSEGAVEVELEPGFRKNNELRVETPSAVCGAVACNYMVQYREESGSQITTISCSEGEVSASGNYFSIAGIGAGEQITVARTSDGKVTTITVDKGSVTAEVEDPPGTKKQVTLNEGDKVIIGLQDGKVVYTIQRADTGEKQDIVGAWPNITVGSQIVVVPVVPPVVVPPPPPPPPRPPITVVAPIVVPPTPTQVGKRGE